MMHAAFVRIGQMTRTCELLLRSAPTLAELCSPKMPCCTTELILGLCFSVYNIVADAESHKSKAFLIIVIHEYESPVSRSNL
eukprot:scaffold1144_cov215-Pinguiococcus_pyrenoidosus.AAC.9